MALERLLELLSASSGQDHADSTSVACYSLAPHQPGLFDAINEAGKAAAGEQCGL
jgi:hypothetical protein